MGGNLTQWLHPQPLLHRLYLVLVTEAARVSGCFGFVFCAVEGSGNTAIFVWVSGVRWCVAVLMSHVNRMSTDVLHVNT